MRYAREETEEQYRERIQSRERHERGTTPTPLAGRVRPGLVRMEFPARDLEVWGTDEAVEIKALEHGAEHE
jgi:hypothetical protein